MRTIKNTILFLSLFIYCNVDAQKVDVQSEIKIPKFERETVVLRTLEATGYYDPTLTISDGSEVKFTLELQTLKPKNEGANAKTLATVINELKKQGYKLISSNSGGGGGANTLVLTVYLFQKE